MVHMYFTILCLNTQYADSVRSNRNFNRYNLLTNILDNCRQFDQIFVSQYWILEPYLVQMPQPFFKQKEINKTASLLSWLIEYPDHRLSILLLTLILLWMFIIINNIYRNAMLLFEKDELEQSSKVFHYVTSSMEYRIIWMFNSMCIPVFSGGILFMN